MDVRGYLQQVLSDERITKPHLCVYVAIINAWLKSGGSRAFYITRRQIMSASKVSGLATYHKCVSDLATWGYFVYDPSYNPAVGTTITFPF